MHIVVESSIGNLLLRAEKDRIVEISFTDQTSAENETSDLLLKAKSQLEAYLNGSHQEFDLPLEPAGTEFQQRVWNELTKIPYGTTISYLELAKRLGNVKTIRAAASANGKNPIGIVIPCHRVIGSNGEMTGYAGGIKRKKSLLELEGAPVMSQINIF